MARIGGGHMSEPGILTLRDFYRHVQRSWLTLVPIETLIMDVVWTAFPDSLTVREIMSRTDHPGPLHYQTIMKVIRILRDKELLDRRKQNHQWLYFAAQPRPAYEARCLQHILASAPHPQETMQSFVNGLSGKELIQLRSHINAIVEPDDGTAEDV